jgi:hypothetical protein
LVSDSHDERCVDDEDAVTSDGAFGDHDVDERATAHAPVSRNASVNTLAHPQSGWQPIDEHGRAGDAVHSDGAQLATKHGSFSESQDTVTSAHCE